MSETKHLNKYVNLDKNVTAAVLPDTNAVKEVQQNSEVNKTKMMKIEEKRKTVQQIVRIYMKYNENPIDVEQNTYFL